MAAGGRRDRLTWVAYALLGWFAFLQTAPGVVLVHLREEFHMDFTTSGVHVAGFAAGSMVAGSVAARLERRFGRGRLLWSGAAVLAVGTVALTAGRVPAVTGAAVVIMGLGGGLVLTTLQATLADHQPERATVALAEANVVASVGFVVLVGGVALASAFGGGWRLTLLLGVAAGLVIWVRNRSLPIDGTMPPAASGTSSMPRIFLVALAVLFCSVGAEWCVVSWGATYVDVSTTAPANVAVLVMGGYFGGVLVGRTIMSRLALVHTPVRLLAGSLAFAFVGFAILRLAATPPPAVLGLFLLGLGVGNLYPMGVALAVSLAPGLAGRASALVVAVTATAAFVAPFTVGLLADATGLSNAMLIVPVMLAGVALTLLTLTLRAARVGHADPAPSHPGV